MLPPIVMPAPAAGSTPAPAVLGRAARVSILIVAVIAGVALVLGVQALMARPLLAQGFPQKRIPEPGSLARATPSAPTELNGALVYEFLVAEIALQRGKPQLGAEAYLDLARKLRDPRVAERATEVAWAARMPQVALNAASLWGELEPNSVDAGGWMLQILVATNRLEEAKPGLTRMLGKATDDRPFLQLGRLLSGVPDKAAALRLMRELAAPYPDNAAAHMALAQVAAVADDSELALTHARAAATQRTDWELPVLLEAQIIGKRSPAQAQERLRQFSATHPKAADVRLAYARSLAASGQFDQARIEFRRLAEAYPDNPEVIYPVALISLQLEDYPAAERYLRQLLEINYPDQDLVHLYLGQAIEEQKRYAEAIESYRQVSPGEHYRAARTRLALAMGKSGDLAGARAFLHTPARDGGEVAREQRIADLLIETQLLRDAKRPEEAFDLIDRALVQHPDDAELLYEQGMLAERLNRIEVMERSLRRVIAIKPDQAQAYNALGYSLADRGLRLAEARELIEHAVRLAPEDFFIKDSLGWVQFRQGDLSGALQTLQQAYAGRPDTEIGAHLGEVLWQMGRRDEANKVWTDALRRSPDNETLKSTLQRLEVSAGEAH